MKKRDRTEQLFIISRFFSALAFLAFCLLLGVMTLYFYILPEIEFNSTIGQLRSSLDDPHAYVTAKIYAYELYRSCAADVKKIIPGVVCWGDEAAVGKRNCSLARMMNEALNHALFDSFEEAVAPFYSSINLNIPIFNRGVQNEGMNEILARCGASPILVSEDYTIPAYGYISNIPLADAEGNELRFAIQPYISFDRTTIQGVPGYLYAGTGSYDAIHPHIAFSRDSLGGEVNVSKGTRVKTKTAEMYRRFLPILYFQSALGQTDEAFVRSLNKMVKCHKNTGGYYAVIVCAEEHSSLDDALAAAFGARYIRGEKKTADMNEADYIELARAVYDCLEEQGAFDAVRESFQAEIERLAGMSF